MNKEEFIKKMNKHADECAQDAVRFRRKWRLNLIWPSVLIINSVVAAFSVSPWALFGFIPAVVMAIITWRRANESWQNFMDLRQQALDSKDEVLRKIGEL